MHIFLTSFLQRLPGAQTDEELCFIPTNLHVQDLFVRRVRGAASSKAGQVVAERRWTTVTVGAFAAHHFKFKQGGLLQLEEELRGLGPFCYLLW